LGCTGHAGVSTNITKQDASADWVWVPRTVFGDDWIEAFLFAYVRYGWRFVGYEEDGGKARVWGLVQAGFLVVIVDIPHRVFRASRVD